MALNRFMHPRNPYKNNRPDFKKLALEHEAFRKVAKQSMTGNVTLDFKDPPCLRALSQALLKSDFGLEVDFPSDRLIPTIPQRLNYILWIEDILADQQLDNVVGIDVGCGSSCIYPLLGHKKNKWTFIATEADPLNLKYARENVSKNKFTDYITVLEADDTLISTAVEQHCNKLTDGGGDSAGTQAAVDFCMCNPPFFDTDELVNCREERAEPKHVSTASHSEKIVAGGEIEFVKKMIDESLELRTKVKVYTSMLGKKSSVSKVKQHLKESGITNFSTSEFCQGRTMRWAVAWTFDSSIVFPRSLFQQERTKGKAGLVHRLSPDMKCCVYDVPALVHHFKEVLLKQLEMKSTTLHQDVGEFISIVVASKNTWSHSRRKRRRERFQQSQPSNPQSLDSGAFEQSVNSGDPTDAPSNKNIKIDSKSSEADNSRLKSGEDSSSCDEKPLITFSLELRLEGIHIQLHLKLIDSEQKDTLHQIMQYFKNRVV